MIALRAARCPLGRSRLLRAARCPREGALTHSWPKAQAYRAAPAQRGARTVVIRGATIIPVTSHAFRSDDRPSRDRIEAVGSVSTARAMRSSSMARASSCTRG